MIEHEYREHGYIEEDETHIHFWKASTLWRLAESMPVEDVPLTSFDWTNDNFEFTAERTVYWREIGDEARRILNADLRYPVIISADGNVMDGMHRILKCHIFGVPTVKAVRFTTTPPPDQSTPRIEKDTNDG